jgi:ankyrin repeat protein
MYAGHWLSIFVALLLTSNLLTIKPLQLREGYVYGSPMPKSKEKDELEIFSRGSIKAIKKLLDNGFDINKRHPKTGETPLMYACEGKRADIVELLIARGANINSKNSVRNSALMLSVYNNNLLIAKMLLSAEAKVNIHNNRGYSPLTMAVIVRNQELVEALLKAGAKVQINKLETTALHKAAESGQVEIAERLLGLGANINVQDDSDQSTPLMYAVKRKHPEMIRLLVSEGITVNTIKRKQLEMVKFLVSKGANVNANDKHGKTVLIKAIDAENAEVVEVLLKNKAEVDADGGEALFVAASGDPMVLKAILNAGPKVNVKTKFGRTPLMGAVFHDGHRRTTKNVEMLLTAGADPTVRESDGEDALSYAREGKYRPLIRLLEKAVKTWKDNNKK